MEARAPINPRQAELHAFGFRAILEVAREALGPAVIDQILASLGVNSTELEDPNAWFSAEFAEALIAEVTERTKDPTWLARAMRLGVSPRYLGTLYPLVHAFGSPQFAYRQIVKQSGRFNKITSWSLDSVGLRTARLSARGIPGTPRERTTVMCECRATQLVAVPTLFDLPPAKLVHDSCMVRGDEACVYDVAWQDRRHGHVSWIALLVGLVTGWVLAITWHLASLPATLLVAICGTCAWALGRRRELAHDLRARADDTIAHQDALVISTRAHEDRFKELLEAKSAVDEKVAQRTRQLQEAGERLSAMLAEIQAIDKAKTDFFNNVSHELRSPLTLILGPLEDLTAGRMPPGGNASAYITMQRNAQRLLHLINQLLDLAKVDAAQMKIAPVRARIDDLVRSIAARFEGAADRKGVQLSVLLPEVVAPMTIDVSWIESAIANLVANALRLTPPGRGVRITLFDPGPEVVVEVSDDGPGVAPEDQAKIFERFAQGDSTKRIVGGTGIGLALVREAARLHGGDVTLVSERGHGATFRIALPRQLPAAVHSEVPAAVVTSQQPPSPRATYDVREESIPSAREGPGPNAALVFVVEDNPDLREFIADILAERYRVRTFSSGQGVVVHASKLRPEAIVSDVAMPEMDGYDLCRAIRAEADTASIPVLLVTARTEMTSVMRGFELGANDYVLKPFHGRELLARVDVHVQLRRMVEHTALRERHAMLGVLAASVAHQVRNPLTSLVGGLPAMRSRLEGKASQSTLEMMDVMIDSAERISRMTNDLMDLSRVDREVAGAFRACDGLRSAIRLLNARMGVVQIEERVEDSALSMGRAGDINQAFMSVLDNAQRAAGNQGRVRAEAFMRGSNYIVRILDSGPGIDDEAATHIFEPFYTTRPAGEGTGLGLTQARRALMQCGGSISFGRGELGGALFTIELPTVASSSRKPDAQVRNAN